MIYDILDDYVVRKYYPKTKKAILIRILEPSYKNKIPFLKDKAPYKINTLDKYQDVLTLYFMDISEELEGKHNLILFSEQHIKKIIRFLDKNSDCEEIIIHCSRGQSRSPAVMIGISKILNIIEIEKEILSTRYFTPNKLILKRFEDYLLNKK